MKNGYQITFFTHQDRRHKGKQIGEWLMQLVREMGLRGASLHTGGESFARGGRVHSAHFFGSPLFRVGSGSEFRRKSRSTDRGRGYRQCEAPNSAADCR